MHQIQPHDDRTTSSGADDSAANLLHILPNRSIRPSRNAALDSCQYQTLSPPNVSSLLGLIREHIAAGRPFFGIEISPSAGTGSNACLDYRRFGDAQPLFTSIAWLQGGGLPPPDRAECLYSSPKVPIQQLPGLQLAQRIRSACGPAQPVLNHLTCERMTEVRALDLCDHCDNVLILRGDRVQPDQPFQHAIDMVCTVRASPRHQRVCIAVAAYPEAHPQAATYAEDLQHLVAKCRAAAPNTFVITQLCWYPHRILAFLQVCRARGVRCPVVVGVFVPGSLAALRRMCRLCDADRDGAVCAQYAKHARSEAEFVCYAVQRARAMIELLMYYGVMGFQFFTLNRFDLVEKVVKGIEWRRLVGQSY